MAGTIQADTLVLGDQATQSQNLVIKTNNDGTFTFERGDGTDLITIDAVGVVDAPSGLIATMAKKVPSVARSDGTMIATDTGKCIATTTSLTVPNNVFSAGDVVSIYNQTGTTMNIVPASGVSLIVAGSAASATRTLTLNGIATIWFRDPSVGIIGGSGVA
jgi:hypothetical protein